MPTYHGSCHCGRIRFEIEATIDTVTACNCSICAKKGILHHRVPPDRFRLVTGGDALGTYRFGTMAAQHLFCTVCGIHTFTRPRAAPELYTVNVRCLDDFDLAQAKPRIVAFDGRNWERAVSGLR